MLIILICAFVPYLKLSPLSSDVQPYFLLAFLLWLFIRSVATRKMPIYPATLALSVFAALAGAFLNAGVMAISLAVMPIAVDVISRQPQSTILRAAKAATVVLAVGALLNVFAEDLLSGLVSNYRGSIQRGFNSFNSEPSYLGITGLALTGVFLCLRANVVWPVASSVLLLISGSATAVAPMLIMLLMRFTTTRTMILFPLLLVAAWYAAVAVSETNSRIGDLIYQFLNSPSLLFLDVSASNRMVRAFGPLIVAFQDFFVPHDFSQPIDVYFDFVSTSADDSVERLSSVATTLFYGLGLLSTPMIIAYFAKAKAPAYIWFLVVYACVTNISIATPYIYILLALPLMPRWPDAGAGSGSGQEGISIPKSKKPRHP